MEHVAKFPSFHIPNRKTDWKAFGLFGEHPNYQWAYPDAPWARQQQVVAEYRRYIVSLLHFFRTDPAVPASLRAQYATLGLPLDEYNRSAHWTPQLYVRSALRLIGEHLAQARDERGEPVGGMPGHPSLHGCVSWRLGTHEKVGDDTLPLWEV